MRLNQARERAGLTLEEAGQRLGVSSQYVWKLERGVNTPPAWERLRDMCKEYGVSADWLLCFIDEPTPAKERTMPAYGPQMLALLRSMPESKQAEIYDVARAMTDHAHTALEDEAMRAMAASALDALLGPDAREVLAGLVERITNGDKAGALTELRLILERQSFPQNEGQSI